MMYQNYKEAKDAANWSSIVSLLFMGILFPILAAAVKEIAMVLYKEDNVSNIIAIIALVIAWSWGLLEASNGFLPKRVTKLIGWFYLSRKQKASIYIVISYWYLVAIISLKAHFSLVLPVLISNGATIRILIVPIIVIMASCFYSFVFAKVLKKWTYPCLF